MNSVHETHRSKDLCDGTDDVQCRHQKDRKQVCPLRTTAGDTSFVGFNPHPAGTTADSPAGINSTAAFEDLLFSSVCPPAGSVHLRSRLVDPHLTERSCSNLCEKACVVENIQFDIHGDRQQGTAGPWCVLRRVYAGTRTLTPRPGHESGEELKTSPGAQSDLEQSLLALAPDT